MTKKLLAFALVMMLAVGLMAGCTDNGGAQSTASTAPSTASAPSQADGGEAEPVTLQWALWDFDQTAYYQPIIDAYIAENPHVTIEYTDLGSSDYMNMLQTQLAGGANFDVVTIKDMPGYANLINQGQLESLNDYIAAESIDTGVYGGTVEQVTVDGQVYQLPFRSDFWIVYYNKDVFDAQGVDYPTNDMTLEQYDEIARAVVNGEGNDKVYGAHYHTWRSAVQLFGILDGQNTIVDGTYEFLKPYYELILKEQDDGIVMDYATAVSTSSHYRDLFYNGKIAMMNMGSWQIASQIQAVKDGETDVANWGIVKYPHPEGVEAGTTLGTITGLAVSKNAPNKEEALKFLKWVTGAEGAAVVASTGTIPAIHDESIMSEITGIDGYPTDDNSKEALQTSQIYLEMPMHEKSAEIEQVLNEEHTEIMTGNKTVDDGLAAMDARVAEVLNS